MKIVHRVGKRLALALGRLCDGHGDRDRFHRAVRRAENQGECLREANPPTCVYNSSVDEAASAFPQPNQESFLQASLSAQHMYAWVASAQRSALQFSLQGRQKQAKKLRSILARPRGEG